MQVLIVRNKTNSATAEAALLLTTFLSTQEIGFTSVDSTELDGLEPAAFDMAVVLGGDGTILRTADFIGLAETPILGINFGRLGFLANGSEDGVLAVVAAALAGDVQREERTNLNISVLCEGDDVDAFDRAVAGGDMLPDRGFFALNEIAVTRGASGRIIDFGLDIAGNHVADMRGDGLVVASATGSTAYALSAGGPLVAPGFNGLVVVPVAPHALNSRALVTGGSDVVEVNMASNPATLEATVFIDGRMESFPAPIKRIVVSRNNTPTVLLRYKAQGFYSHAAQVFF